MAAASSAVSRPTAVLVRMIDRSDAVSAEKMRVDFVANASHELRTPLSTVLGYAETLAEEHDLPDDFARNSAATIRDEARRMLRIIEDLMSLSRIEADRFVAPNDRSPSPRSSIPRSRTRASLRSAADASSIVDLPADLAAVRGDHAQLVQLLDNLHQQCRSLRLRAAGFADRDFRCSATAAGSP